MHKILNFQKLTGLFLIFMSSINQVSSAEEKLAYPEGFRTWTHIKSQIATDAHPRFNSIGGIHHIYANDNAMIGYKNGKFPEGSIIVFDLLELQNKDGSLIEGKRRWIGVMEKDTKKYISTSGWGYENFAGNSKSDRNVPVNGPSANCFACHQPKASNDFVFSSLRD
jgi:hypothetical protein